MKVLKARDRSKTKVEPASSSKRKKMMSDLQCLSRQLFSVLEDVGASDEIRELHQQTAADIEILYTIWSKHSEFNTLFHICGSRYEGSVTPDMASDTDTIACNLEIPVFVEPVCTPQELTLLMVKDSWTYPGYVKLQYVENGHPLTEGDNTIVEDTRYDVFGRLCHVHMDLGSTMQGPACMLVSVDGEHYQDSVLAFKCNNIPAHTNEWITRQRHHGWPTTEQIETMGRMGCMVVMAGHWQSNERDLEWRVSFSLQERLLMSSLNPVQHKVYIILKMIKKNILGNNINGESLSSYHCKTCIFHAAERKPVDFWTPDNLINCIMYCLRLLLQWTEDEYCPNYFIKEQNLFLKEGFMRVRFLLKSELQKLIAMKHHLIYLLESDHINNLMRNGNVKEIRSSTDARKHEYVLNLKRQVIYYNAIAYFTILNKSKDLQYTLCELQSTDTINDHSKHETQTVVHYLEPWLHLHIAKCITARAKDTDVSDMVEKLLERANEHFCYASRTDVAIVRFAKGSIMYSNGQYEECRKLLLEIEGDLTFKVMSYCPCNNNYYCLFRDEQQERELTKMMSEMSVTNILQHHCSSCVVFLRSESAIAPLAMQYEIYRSLDTMYEHADDTDGKGPAFAAVDARVYLYFLQYLVYDALYMVTHKQVALDNLKSHIEECNNRTANTGKCILEHKETAYNLLGWIYLQQNHVADALHCFKESLKIRPDCNAAVFHLKEMQ